MYQLIRLPKGSDDISGICWYTSRVLSPRVFQHFPFLKRSGIFRTKEERDGVTKAVQLLPECHLVSRDPSFRTLIHVGTDEPLNGCQRDGWEIGAC